MSFNPCGGPHRRGAAGPRGFPRRAVSTLTSRLAFLLRRKPGLAGRGAHYSRAGTFYGRIWEGFGQLREGAAKWDRRASRGTYSKG